MKLYEKYDTEIPQEVVGIIAALGDPIRRAILVLLSKQAEFSFSDLQKGLGIGKLTLNYHLKNLYSAGLVDHYFRHELGNQKYSYYAVTSLGKRALRSLVEMLTPPEYPLENAIHSIYKGGIVFSEQQSTLQQPETTKRK